MLFNSIFFLFVFFPIVAGIYFLLPQRFRWGWLLLASCYFYMCFIPQYILILAFTITLDYFAGIYIEKFSGRKRRNLLILSIISNIGVLFIFKYFNFFNANLTALSQLLDWNYSLNSLAIILPIGLSFHTFQSLSYIIEVYRGKQKAEKNYGIYALYVLFFPQLVAGPIERPQNLLRQFYERHFFELERFFSGLRLIIWGLFKKAVIADRISVFANLIFNNAHDFSGPHFILAGFLFTVQIYCDFSGYSDMARGLARILGFELMINFNAPFFSKSVAEFWRRWHISLSSWFRDYVYIPLGGNRVSQSRWQYNIFLTFLLTGIWHGANWTFVIWGCLNGFFIIFSRQTAEIRDRISNFFQLNGTTLQKFYQTAITFTLISLSLIIFRAESLSTAGYIFSQILANGLDLISLWPFIDERLYSLLIIFCSIAFLTLVDFCLADTKKTEKLLGMPIIMQLLAFAVITFVIMLLGRFDNNQFIYFQF